MAPNKVFHNLEESTHFIPCPVSNKQLKSKGGLTKHMSSAHPNYQGHFSSQFVYTTNEINKDEDYYHTNNNNSSTDNDNNLPSPLHVVPPAFSLPLDQMASPDATYVEHSWLIDVDQDFYYGNEDASSLSDIPCSASFDQSHLQANCPNTGHQPAPKECFTRTYHPELNGEC